MDSVVGALVVKRRKVLILKRKQSDDFLPGLWELPSGKVEDGEDLIEALNREVEEETSQRIKRVTDYAGHFDYLSKSGKKKRQFN
ncbi:MAG: NUDIX domain-containing protein [Methanobacteriota archaeon]|nr:MAG: NUDIX domain-containing protein [Euryarchaeota archaeon]